MAARAPRLRVEKRKGVSANVASSVIGQGVYLATQVGVLSSLAHLRGLEAVGQFGLALAIATPVFVIGGQGLRVLQAVDAQYQATFPEYLGSRLVGLAAAVVATLLIGDLITRGLDVHILFSVTLMKAAESVCDTAYGAYQRLERLDLQARSQILRGTAGVLLFYLLLRNGASVSTALYAQVIVWWSVALLVDFPMASIMTDGRLKRPRMLRRGSVTLLWRALPVSSEMFVINLQKSGQRYIVADSLGYSDLGTFTAIDYVQQAGVMLANAISQAVLGNLARLRADAEHRSADRLVLMHACVMLAIATCGILFITLFGKHVVSILIGVRTHEAQQLLLLVAIAVAIRVVTTAPAAHLYVCGLFRSTFAIQLVSSIVAVAFAALLVPRIGLVGAGYAVLVATCFRSASIVTLYVHSRREPRSRQADRVDASAPDAAEAAIS